VLDAVTMTGTIHGFWRRCRAKFDKNHRRNFDGVMIYFWWNIWKERNRRTFQQQSMQASQVTRLYKDDITQFHLATTEHVQEE
jgi:hypothetical protein